MIHINYTIQDIEDNIKQHTIPNKTYKLTKIKELPIDNIVKNKEVTTELQLQLYELTYIITYGIKLLHKNNFIISEQLITSFRSNINNACGINLKNDEYQSILTLLVSKKDDIIKLFLSNIDYNNAITTNNILKVIDLNQQTGGSLTWMYDSSESSEYTKILDIVGLIIDIIGFIPGIGIAIDATGFILSVSRSQWYNSICSLINMIPVIGSFIGTPLKYLRRYDRIKKLRELQNMTIKKID